ncbi:putative RNA-binding Zn ribbon-like protein [Nocardioides albertanoniae]|uniref:Putative RNA-binding Zn ribbon-like protein n=1 Tax=Nocardioides albertanoniae TaxID=1175486 RepID=A0A543A4J4_9ACTN|nr:CGNR zinc finger domain-containing protein [Nocardioides albertanoniae]TQL67521.1 putative RNA-binding Zn ribbon-like protein [Nocardioides albertanoniae]
MVFTHDTGVGLQAAASLANTLALSPGAVDELTTVDDLSELFESYGYTGRHDRTRAELDEVRALRPRLRDLLVAEEGEAVRLANQMLAEHDATPQLVRHTTYDWHIHATGFDAPLATRIAVETAMAMVDVIRTDELSRLAVCADEGCAGIVVDLSRNRSKRYCSATCTNRNAVAAYRERQGAAGGQTASGQSSGQASSRASSQASTK